MGSTIVMMILGVLTCTSGALIVAFRTRLTNWQNGMNREFGWNPRGRQQVVSVGGMTVIGCIGMVCGAVLVTNAFIRILG
ncbi:hypothetical protein [Herbiconiux daphne]|uniref:Uncharacterized protein n=1 Tax=Herbiconiux daphne TaxID=2970914 RepID=A0ABT2H529_9MICO|nr:hypothetical protein [Herbiconiux daphne]MCS5735044.1 hypothetical protein [Herbiconiux daphne]